MELKSYPTQFYINFQVFCVTLITDFFCALAFSKLATFSGVFPSLDRLYVKVGVPYELSCLSTFPFVIGKGDLLYWV